MSPSTTHLPSIQLEDVEPATGQLRAGALAVSHPAGQNVFSPGDVVFGKLRPYLSKSWLVSTKCHGSGEFMCLRPNADQDARFLLYVTLSRPWLEHASLGSYGAKMPRTSWEQMASFPIPLHSVDEQRRIADFLDDRVARIDKIIAARRRQLDHLEAMTGSLFLDVLRARGVPAPTSVETGWDRVSLPHGWRSTDLGRVLRQLTNGFVGPTRDILVDSGIPYIQSVHIKNGQIQFARRPFYVSADWHDARPRINLRAGDVLIVQTGDIGQVALVPEGYGPASCHALLIARADPKLISPAFLAEALRSSFGYQCMLSRATGALHPHLEAGVRSTPLVLPPLDEQDEVVTRIARRRATLHEGGNSVRGSIDLLTEYKQSLITAAVTGELDVTTASKALPE